MFLKISQNSLENTCARVSFLIKLLALFKKRLWHKCFPVNFTKFRRTPRFTEHLRWLLLQMFSFKFYETVLNRYFKEHHHATVSETFTNTSFCYIFQGGFYSPKKARQQRHINVYIFNFITKVKNTMLKYFKDKFLKFIR